MTRDDLTDDMAVMDGGPGKDACHVGSRRRCCDDEVGVMFDQPQVQTSPPTAVHTATQTVTIPPLLDTNVGCLGRWAYCRVPTAEVGHAGV